MREMGREEEERENPKPALPEAVAVRISALNGSRVELLSSYRPLKEKELAAKGGLNHLSILADQQIDRGFLSDKERVFLNDKVMRAKLIQPNFEEIDVVLKKFDLRKEINGDYYAVFTINRVWIPIVLHHHHPSSSSQDTSSSSSSNFLHIWTFRTPNGQLWFVMVRL